MTDGKLLCLISSKKKEKIVQILKIDVDTKRFLELERTSTAPCPREHRELSRNTRLLAVFAVNNDISGSEQTPLFLPISAAQIMLSERATRTVFVTNFSGVRLEQRAECADTENERG